MFASSQKAQITHSLRLQMAMSEAEKAARGQRITDLREREKLTQPEVADFVGVTLRAYQRWEAGDGITRDNLEKLGELYKVDWRAIDRGDTSPTPDPFASPDQLPYKAIDVERAIRMEAKLDALLEHFKVDWMTPEAATKPKRKK